MSGYLLDTDVIAMLAPSRTEATPAFLGWLDRMDADGRLRLSVVAIHEIEKGIALLEHKGANAKAASLKAWLAGLVATYDDKILPVDTAAAALAGHAPGMADATIDGIAKAHDLVIVTRDTKHFGVLGVEVASPDETTRTA